MKRSCFLIACGVLLSGCVMDLMQLTEPCAQGCNEQAVLGSPCAVAEDCPTDVFCNLTFPGGYCQVACTATGEACGPQEDGVCVANSGGEIQALCLAGCDAAQPQSCANAGAVCYDRGEGQAGVCGLKCATDNDCEAGQACDGQGICRVVDNQCNGLTDSGCGDLGCYLANSNGTFCGLPGEAALGEACSTVASCEQNLWCIQGQCRRRCDTDDFVACGGVPALGVPLVRGTRLGFCER